LFKKKKKGGKYDTRETWRALIEQSSLSLSLSLPFSRRERDDERSSSVKSALIRGRIFSLPPPSFFLGPCVIDSDVDMAIGRGRIDVDEYVECERHTVCAHPFPPFAPEK